MGESGGEVINGVIEIEAKSELFQRRGKNFIHRLVKALSKNEVSEGRRQAIHSFVEFISKT